MFRPLIGIPMLEMAALAKARGIRFIVLLIPSAAPDAAESEFAAALKRRLADEGIESLDLAPDLRDEPSRYAARPEPPLIGMLKRLAHVKALGALGPAFVIERFSRIIRFRRDQERRNFVDPSGHPSRKGHRIIARRIWSALDRSPAPGGSGPRGRSPDAPR